MASCTGCVPGAARRRARRKRSGGSPCLRLRFQRVLTHFDLFDNVIAQRSDAETGVWLSGLDNIAADALRLRGRYFELPPVVCYLDRGMGAAIRRARTRLPGGGSNPVAIVKIPRERLVGNGITSSRFHEVGPSGGGAARSCGIIAAGLTPASSRIESERCRGLAPLGALDFRDRRRCLVGGAFGHRFDLRADRRRQPAATVRLPSQGRRSASSAVYPGETQRCVRQGLYPQPAWGRLIELWESYYPTARSIVHSDSSLRTWRRPSRRWWT